MKTAKFKESPNLKNLIKKCRDLEFDVLKEGKDGDLIGLIADAEITPYFTGYTQEHNEIVREGKQRILCNTNTEYGKELYDSGREFVPHHALDGSGKNANPRDNWMDVGDDGYKSTVEFTRMMIEKEIQDELHK